MLVCGIDIGSTTIEVVLHNGERVVGSRIARSGAFPAEHAKNAFHELLSELNLRRSDIDRIVTTGFGRNYFSGADRVASEITCHAIGVIAEIPSARTVIEIGGQDSKMMQLDEMGRVREFVMNDRCAAGTGKFIETISRTLNLPVEETGPLGLAAEQACEISSMCAVFAESEIVGLLHQGKTPADVLRGVFNSVARRILGMAGRIGLRDEIVFTGGVARNAGVHKALEEITGHTIRVPSEPHFTGALGAAILAGREIVGTNRIIPSSVQEVE
ncbi:MAG: acyl-CoA dehydratase activase [Ignavibacteriales bacterium]|nr:acyl-CoA dehydratase activase [Ignavibacteriales bacterium]